MLSEPPIITLVIIGVSVIMSFSSSFINNFFTPKEHREKVKAMQHKVSALQKEKNENMKTAKSTGDKKLLKKAQKQEKQLLQLQSQVAAMSMKQMRVLPLTMVMFLIVWLLLTGSILGMKLFDSPFYTTGAVAFLPWFDGVMSLSFFYWYLICSFFFGTLWSRIFGLTGGID
ncbi:MAG: EMC3/TMCO1 family protein [Candidatus Bathyarchaeota archaeon]|nr:EMC3/TMCO1 family protein [Candidatus Bathyarchaeota archaeon]